MVEASLLHGSPGTPEHLTGDPCRDKCALCGLPVAGSAPTIPDATGCDREHRFCCLGCRQVFALLSDAEGHLPGDFQTTAVYRACLDAGVIAAVPDARDSVSSHGPEDSAAGLDLTLKVNGMWCPACAWVIEEVLRRREGVSDPRVSFFADTLRLKYMPTQTSPGEIASLVGHLGYTVSSTHSPEGSDKVKRDLLLRLGVSAILTMNIMMLSFALYFGFLRHLAPVVVAYLSYPIFLITIPVVFYGGMPILRKAWMNLRHGHTSMETLVGLGVLAAFVYSIVQLLKGSIHLYFDTAAMLVTLVLLGRYMEMKAHDRVTAGIGELEEVTWQKVRLAGDSGERWVSADEVRRGDRIIVRQGERISVDGRVAWGEGFLDESILTGEPQPVAAGPGRDVTAGALLAEGELEIIASCHGRESFLRRMVAYVAEALERKSGGEELADRASRLLVPATIAVAGLTGLILWFFRFTGDEILMRCLTILLISCPCALGIATPMVKVATIGLGRSKGILIRNPAALGRMEDLDTVVFDKTGTVTEGTFQLRHLHCDELEEKDLFSLIAPLEAGSTHFLAREVLKQAADLGLSSRGAVDVEHLQGLGVRGLVAGRMVLAGSRRLFAHCGVMLPDDLLSRARTFEEEGMTVVFFGWDGKAKGFLVFGDSLRAGAGELVEWLKDRGMGVLLLSGDGNATTAAIAQSLGIKGFLGQTLPAEKAEIVETLQRQGRMVAMVGDGINDAQALARADVAFALGAGHDVMKEASDLLILGGKMQAIRSAFELSRLSGRAMRRNLWFAFIYNATAVPVAAAGLLNPLIAVCIMFMSSLSVIGFAMHLSRQGKQIPGEMKGWVPAATDSGGIL